MRKEIRMNRDFKWLESQSTCIMGSDSRTPDSPTHEVSATGTRYINLKVEAVSIYGIKQALLDPTIRVRFPNEYMAEPENTIEAMWINGGFLDGQNLRFSRDLTCFIGATGTGKSFTLELVRQVLMQNSNIERSPMRSHLYLRRVCEENCRVCLIVRKGASTYLIERAFEDGAVP